MRRHTCQMVSGWIIIFSMRASRLLSILTTLQARGRVTAGELAQACEVSLRTIYRDIDALSAAGIPVYSERGSEGGYRLLDGYRTQLNGLSAKEAEALFMLGLSGVAADLGLGSVMMAAQTKLLSAVPPAMRAGAEQMRARFHLDAPAWFAEAEQPAHLPVAAAAVWDQHAIRIRYRSWRAERERVVAPLGLVLKGGAWYLVGQVDGDARTYRVSRILELVVLNRGFERPPGFDLEAYWRAGIRRLEVDLYPNRARVRLSPWGVRMLGVLTSPYVQSETMVESESDASGWRLASIPVGSISQACVDLLRFGVEIEVLAPPDLRSKMAELAAGLTAIYQR
jgi:predicted DNA-binding transcriptional regulator YafY